MNKTSFKSYALSIFSLILCFIIFDKAIADPTITIWNGNSQDFGNLGNPQKWVNILGNVSDPDGIENLEYTLNGGVANSLSIGPNSQRLVSDGDFVIELSYFELLDGVNEVIITATDSLANSNADTVNINYTSGNYWAEPYSISWSGVTDITDVVQVVDGQWSSDASGVTPTVVAYDRVLALGDITWTDYELTVPVTIHGIDTAGFGGVSGSPGFGVTFRWRGHTNDNGSQPNQYWLPSGAGWWYSWIDELNLFDVKMSLSGEDGNQQLQDLVPLDWETSYIFKMRVESYSGNAGQYQFKYWKASDSEPVDWQLTHSEGADDIASGSAIFIAHHVDLTFGDVNVTVLSDTTGPQISSNFVDATQTTADITWQSNEFGSNSIEYGLTDSYELGTVASSSPTFLDDFLHIEHNIALNSLSPATVYHYQIHSTDRRGNTTSSGDLTFSTRGNAFIAKSDHFVATQPDSTVWTFVNPLSDASVSMTGSQVSIFVPSSATHDVWGSGVPSFSNTLPRIVQPVNEEDFELVIKYDSEIVDNTQQGILIAQDSVNLIRLEFIGSGSNTNAFAATFVEGLPSSQYYINIGFSNISPLYMKVTRQSSSWTQAYSFNGTDWTSLPLINFNLTVSEISLYAGNSSGTEHTALIDYLFNEGDLIVDPQVLLEGATYDSLTNLMSTNLQSGGYLPLTHPYRASPTSYFGNESVAIIPSNIVDWLLLELRSSSDPSVIVAQRAAFLQNDGTILDLDGNSEIRFSGVKSDDYYLAIRHRNHLGVMSASALSLSSTSTLYDFRSSTGQYYGDDAVQLETGVFGMYKGDANSSGGINATDYLVVKPDIGTNGYYNADCNMSGGVNATDYLVVKPNIGKSTNIP